MNWVLRAIGRKIQGHVDEAMKDPDFRERMEQQRHAMDLVGVAETAARSGAGDSDARDTLEGQLPDDSRVVARAVEHLAAVRASYVHDRAFRLLCAARDRTEVRPIDPNVRANFLAEARLGRLPLAEAFAELIELEPRLTRYQTRNGDDPEASQKQIDKAHLVGLGSSSSHAVLRSDLAVEIVRDYVRAQRDPRLFEDDTPVFERRQRSRGHSWVPFKGDPRPHATN